MGSKLIKQVDKYRAKSKLLGVADVEVKVKSTKEVIARAVNENIKKCIIPDFVTRIDSSGFSRCNNITEVIVTDGVTEIGDRAFAFCENLKTVIIGKNVETIGVSAFTHCTKLEQVIFMGNTKIIKNDAFKFCGFSEISLPDSVKIIGESAFCECTSLQKFKVPLGVKTLQRAMLAKCTNLKTIELHDKIVKIGNIALAYTDIEEIDIPKSIKKVMETAFTGCKKLKGHEKLKG